MTKIRLSVLEMRKQQFQQPLKEVPKIRAARLDGRSYILGTRPVTILKTVGTHYVPCKRYIFTNVKQTGSYGCRLNL